MSAHDRTDAQLIRTALVGFAILGLLVLGAVNLGRLPLVGASTTTYQAEFSDASGLIAGEEVRIAGVKVGKVTDIALGRGRVIVTFAVEEQVVGDRSTAAIEVKTVLGQHYLSVVPAGEGELEEGGVIPLERTSTPLNIVPAFNQLASQSAAIDTEQVAEAFDALSEVLERTAPDMRSTLRGLSRLSHSVASRDAQIRRVMERANQVSGIVAARDTELAELLTSTTQLLAVLDRRRDTIVQIIRGTTALSRQLSGLVRDNQAHLRPALEKLDAVLAVLRANRTQLDTILDVGTVYAREFTNVGGSGRWFDATIKAPRGLALCAQEDTPLKPYLSPLFSALNSTVNSSGQPCVPLGAATGGAQ